MLSPETTAQRPAEGTFRVRFGRMRGGDELELQVARMAVADRMFATRSASPMSIGRYVLRRRLGAGAMGVVFCAHDPSLRRDIAIKVLHQRPDSADTLLLQEAQRAARLAHPALVTIFDVGLHQGRVFIAMEQIAGQSMAQWLRSRPPWRHAVAVLARAARGLEAAHARGVIHRDFKPANVLLGHDGRVCIADFGLAREVGDVGDPDLADTSCLPRGERARPHARASHVAGTPAYMAPEQYLATVQDERTDQFAFCVSLYQALFGRTPFEASSFAAMREATLTVQPALHHAPGIPPALLDVMSRGLSKSRRDRFDSMGELAGLLESLSAGVDLRLVFGERESRPDASAPSMFEAYLHQLPDGLDSASEQRLPSRIYQVVLANRPLVRPPAELVPIIKRIPTQAMIPAVHARAILSAVYDEHFDSLERWRAFVGEMSRVAVELMLTSVTVPRPTSPHFAQALAGAYNKSASGARAEVVEADATSATVRFSHAPHTLNDVGLVAWEELVRAAMLGAGCSAVELVTSERTERSFLLRGDWR